MPEAWDKKTLFCRDCGKAGNKVKATRVIPEATTDTFAKMKRKIAVCELHYRERYGLPSPATTRSHARMAAR